MLLDIPTKMLLDKNQMICWKKNICSAISRGAGLAFKVMIGCNCCKGLEGGIDQHSLKISKKKSALRLLHLSIVQSMSGNNT